MCWLCQTYGVDKGAETRLVPFPFKSASQETSNNKGRVFSVDLIILIIEFIYKNGNSLHDQSFIFMNRKCNSLQCALEPEYTKEYIKY